MTMRIVVDASVAAKWLIPESDSAVAVRLLDPPYELCAPRLLTSEVANVLWRNAQSGSLSRYEAGRLANEVTSMSVNWAEDEATSVDAVRIAIELGHPAYDCMYLALAIRIGTAVVTADKRFVSAVAGTRYEPVVIPLQEFFGNDDLGRIHMQAP